MEASSIHPHISEANVHLQQRTLALSLPRCHLRRRPLIQLKFSAKTYVQLVNLRPTAEKCQREEISMHYPTVYVQFCLIWFLITLYEFLISLSEYMVLPVLLFTIEPLVNFYRCASKMARVICQVGILFLSCAQSFPPNYEKLQNLHLSLWQTWQYS